MFITSHTNLTSAGKGYFYTHDGLSAAQPTVLTELWFCVQLDMKIGHFRDILSRQLLSYIWKKLDHNSRHAPIN